MRFRFDGPERLARTLDAIDRHLGHGAFHHRYSGVADEEACFVACSFWMVEARALLGQRETALAKLRALEAALARGVGVFAEMVDPRTGAMQGNLPQGLSHLAHVMALDTLSRTP